MGENSKISKKTWTLLIACWVAMMMWNVIVFSFGMMLPDVMADFNLDYGTAGLIGSVSGFASVLLTIPTAFVATKFNPKYSVPGVMVLLAAGLFLFGIAANVPMLFIGKIIAAAVSNGLASSLVIVKIRQVPAARFTGINGIENFVQPIGQVLATLCMAQLLMLVGGWRNVHIICAVVIVAMVVIWLVTYKDDTTGAAAAATKAPSQKGVMREALKQKTFWLLSLAWPGTTLIWIGMFYYWPSFITESAGMTMAQAGFVLSFIPIFSAIASLTAPKIADKLGRDKLLIWPWGIILPIAYFCMLQTTSIPLLCICAAVAGYGAYCFVPIAFTTLYKLGLRSEVVSVGTGMVLTGVALGSALGSGIVGALISSIGIYKALAICCLSPVWFGILTLFVPERGRKVMEAEAAAAAAKK